MEKMNNVINFIYEGYCKYPNSINAIRSLPKINLTDFGLEITSFLEKYLKK